MKKLLLALCLSITATNVYAKTEVKLLRLYKADRRLEIIGLDNKVIKTYKVMLGKSPIGPKTQEGDNKTPEGIYDLDSKNTKSNFYKSFHISYPTVKQKMKAKFRGVNPGSDIMLHGLPNHFQNMTAYLNIIGLAGLDDDLIRLALPNFDWTSGCIAVTDAEMDEIFAIVNVPTKIVIEP